jgi:hypothetical protein
MTVPATPIATLTPPLLRSVAPSPIQRPTASRSRLEEVGQGLSDEPLELPATPSSQRNALEELPFAEPSAVAGFAPSVPFAPGRRQIDSKDQRAIAELRNQIQSVLAQARDATGNFHQIDRLDQVKSLPASVSSNITILANEARTTRLVVGSDTMMYQHRDEMEGVDELAVLDEATGDLTAKDAPTARNELSRFFQRYSEPSAGAEKEMWHYLNSMFSACDRSMTEAERHLQRAQSFEAAGKKIEALREYQEIYRTYPNPITAEKIRQLQVQPH